MDLRPQLAKRKSQDFKSKVTGWNDVEPAAALQSQDEIIVVEEASTSNSSENSRAASPRDEDPDADSESEDIDEAVEEEVVEFPKTPTGIGQTVRIPVLGNISREVDPGRKAWVRRRPKIPAKSPAKILEKISPDIRIATTPKKRVISDGHWRRDKTLAAKAAATPEKEKDIEKEKVVEYTPKPITIRRSVATVGLKTQPSVAPADLEHVTTRPLGRRSHSPAYESAGTKIFINKNRPDRDDTGTKPNRNFDTSASSYTATSTDQTSTITDLTVPEVTPLKIKRSPQGNGGAKGDSARKIPRRSPGDETRPRPIPRVNADRQVHGWLAEMSDDPFTERARSIPDSADDSRRRTKQSVRDRIYDFESGSVDRYRNGRQRRNRPSLEALERNGRSLRSESLTDDWSERSIRPASTLKRSGARRSTYSPVKERQPSRPQLPLADAKRYVSGPAYDPGVPRAGDLLSHAQHADHMASPLDIDSNSYDSVPQIDGSVLSRASDGDEPRAYSTSLKRQLTKHSDLISVLSISKDNDRASAPIRRNRSKPETSRIYTIGEVMNEVTTDELKYQRELRTMVDGVIPVLLNHMLKSDDSREPGARQNSISRGPAATQPIVDMGVALERLKAQHKRIPMHNPQELLRWADGASKVYEEYLKVWRLGFHDIVVNLAPAEETERKVSWDHALERKPGNLVTNDGERVDVAYLLKRPLVRLKALKKTFTGINRVVPSILAEEIEERYHRLVDEARSRASDERARLEDEAAAAIDPTRARDLESLEPLNGVEIESVRRVTARDYFDMELFHSSGQQLDCKIEVILRDDPSANGSSGDILFCEVATKGRWLLFPPIANHLVSARDSDREGEIVVMVRGTTEDGERWSELMSLRSSESQSVEWLDMLRSDPVPPRLTRQSSFNALGSRRDPYASTIGSDLTSDIHLPIGERARQTSRYWNGSELSSVTGDQYSSYGDSRARNHGYDSQVSIPYERDTRRDKYSSRYETDSAGPQDYYDDRRGVGRQPFQPRRPTTLGRSRSKSEYSLASSAYSSKKDYSVWLPSSDRGESDDSADEDDMPGPRRPSMRRRTSSVPSRDIPMIPKLRKPAAPEAQAREYGDDPVGKMRAAQAKLRQSPTPNQSRDLQKSARASPSPLPRQKSTFKSLKSNVPSMTPAFLKKHRRSSSPLKHEYEPSTASGSSSEDHLSDTELEGSITSESSTGFEGEGLSTLGELKDFGRYGSVRVRRQRQQPRSYLNAVVDDDGLGPSDSASQAGPRHDLSPFDMESTKTVASIFCWSDNGTWASMHPQECEIVVTPGLIEAFDIAQAQQVSPNAGDPSEPSPSQRGVKPLVALELTPLVPLRRGTALDISIRSPPTSNSLLRNGNNIMFRSRTPEDCEKLYNHINRARIDNPTWIALQNARGPVPTSNWAGVMDRRNSARSNSGSWFKSLTRKSSTYRSNGTRAVSTAATESSIGTMNSALSALRRFSGGSSGRFFNIGKSTIISRDQHTRSTGSDSLDSGVATPMTLDTSLGTPVGITNTKIRLWLRESPSKWRDLGSARLTILIPPRSAASASGEPSATMPQEKRILVTGKSRDHVILDFTLPESSFERVARTGIAVNVWDEAAEVRAQGGVLTTTLKVYMMQMGSEREAAYTFSMVGKLRY